MQSNELTRPAVTRETVVKSKRARPSKRRQSKQPPMRFHEMNDFVARKQPAHAVLVQGKIVSVRIAAHSRKTPCSCRESRTSAQQYWRTAPLRGC